MEAGRLFVGLGTASGFVAVAAGAFGAHALRQRLAPEMLTVFETGARYQMYHALALVLVGALLLRGASSSRALDVAGWAFLVGTALFSGSLYLLALTGARKLGAVTPVGGLAFLVGWAALALWAFAGRS